MWNFGTRNNLVSQCISPDHRYINTQSLVVKFSTFMARIGNWLNVATGKCLYPINPCLTCQTKYLSCEFHTSAYFPRHLVSFSMAWKSRQRYHSFNREWFEMFSAILSATKGKSHVTAMWLYIHGNILWIHFMTSDSECWPQRWSHYGQCSYYIYASAVMQKSDISCCYSMWNHRSQQYYWRVTWCS